MGELTLNKSDIELELESGKTVTDEIIATKRYLSKPIIWSSSNPSVATVNASEETKATVTAVTTGETTITATCNVGGEEYTQTCRVTVKRPIEVGSYVQYNVPYIDRYSKKEYTKDNGWRYLGKDDNGNKLIVSTAIPAILRYDYEINIGNTENGGKNSWWATDRELQAYTGIYNTNAGWNYSNSGEPNKYATYGLRYKFESIPFTYDAESSVNSPDVPTANTGMFIKVGNTTSGTNINLSFRASGVNVVDVHNLTLAELNRATSKVTGKNRSDEATTYGYKDLTGTAAGLFDMQDLSGYTVAYKYWIAFPGIDTRKGIYQVKNVDNSFYYYQNTNGGVRPVITISGDTKFVDENGDGIWEIQS